MMAVRVPQAASAPMALTAALRTPCYRLPPPITVLPPSPPALPPLPPASSACNNACPYRRDGECDDGGTRSRKARTAALEPIVPIVVSASRRHRHHCLRCRQWRHCHYRLHHHHHLLHRRRRRRIHRRRRPRCLHRLHCLRCHLCHLPTPPHSRPLCWRATRPARISLNYSLRFLAMSRSCCHPALPSPSTTRSELEPAPSITHLKLSSRGAGATIDGQQHSQAFIVDGGTLELTGVHLTMHGGARKRGCGRVPCRQHHVTAWERIALLGARWRRRPSLQWLRRARRG